MQALRNPSLNFTEITLRHSRAATPTVSAQSADTMTGSRDGPEIHNQTLRVCDFRSLAPSGDIKSLQYRTSEVHENGVLIRAAAPLRQPAYVVIAPRQLYGLRK